jgi:hypothetical protein
MNVYRLKCTFMQYISFNKDSTLKFQRESDIHELLHIHVGYEFFPL